MPRKSTKSGTAFSWLTQQIVGKELPDVCMIWPFAVRKQDGYGTLNIPGTRRSETAHRLAFALFYGHLPNPCGLHRCDIPRCFNPKHIYEGTDADNVLDMHHRHRAADKSGVRNGKAKLTDDAVRNIRRLREFGMPQVAIAKMYGVGQTNISSIIKRKLWKHVGDG